MSMVIEPTRVGRRRRWVAGVAVIAMVGALVTVGWIWRHPTVFPDEGGSVIGYDAATPGVPAYFGIATEPRGASGPITIHSAQANVVADTADARIEFFVCSLDDAGGIGVVVEPGIRQHCSSLVPADGATLELNGTPRQQLLVAVTLTDLGRVEIHGLDLEYSHGWQRGTQHIGADVKVRSRR